MVKNLISISIGIVVALSPLEKTKVMKFIFLIFTGEEIK